MRDKIEKGNEKRGINRYDRAMRIIEIGFSSAGLCLLSPVFLICALMIRADSAGKILFRQKRVGRGGQIFTLYKFRTMISNSTGLSVTACDDGRITKIGKFLRKSKLDELPELYNILSGDMSFVGPRPEVPELVDLSDPLWREVLSVRPGLTDPVTLEFRNEENLLADVEDKKNFYSKVIQPYKLRGYADYLKVKNPVSDLKIILLTFKVILFPQTVPPIPFNKTQFK